MKIISKSFFGTHHSWSHVMRSIMFEFSKSNFISIESINGYSNLPQNMIEHIDKAVFSPDLEICYTMPINFPIRFNKKSKLKMAIYNYETSLLPLEWKDKLDFIDYCLPSSNFTKEIFINSGWKEEKCIVIPHGIDLKSYRSKKTLKFFDKIDSFKFLCVGIPHYRKRFDLIIDSYYSAFSDEDDVLLILKTSLKKPEKYFEINVKEMLKKKQEEFKNKNLPRIMIVDQRIEDMVPLYNSIDCLVNASTGEGFGLPLLECLALNKQVIAPSIGGHTDFLNKENSFVCESKWIDDHVNAQYWCETPGAKMVDANKDSLIEKMKLVYSGSKKQYVFDKKYTWKNVCESILEIK